LGDKLGWQKALIAPSVIVFVAIFVLVIYRYNTQYLFAVNPIELNETTKPAVELSNFGDRKNSVAYVY
jgi:hypothetical protein